MGFSEAVQWWEEWQLRILVLTSAFLQLFLFFAGTLRKVSIPSWLRFSIWLAYLSSDAVAIYGLATLFNQQKTQEWVSTHRRSARVQVLWAPILLIHLGGQDTITAYNIEDNELWRRHVLTAVSQVVVAVYVFWKSWPEDKRLLATGFLLFVIGILKSVLKPWDLKRVSINSLVKSSAGSEGDDGNVRLLVQYIGAATQYFQEAREGQPSGSGLGDEIRHWKWMPYDLFVDLSPPYSCRLRFLKGVINVPADVAHRLVRFGLSATFDRLYTKESLLMMLAYPTPKLLSWITFLRWFVTVCSIAMVFVEFKSIHGEPYDDTDVNITSNLFCLTAALDYIFPAFMQINRTIQYSRAWPDDYWGKRWPDKIAQYNLVGYLVRNKKYRNFRRLATLLVCKDYITTK